MVDNIFNIRLRDGTEIIAEVLDHDEINAAYPGASDLFTDDDLILSHPIVIAYFTEYDSEQDAVVTEYSCRPFLSFSAHACIPIKVSDVQAIDDVLPSFQSEYIQMVVNLYSHLYEKHAEEFEKIEPKQTVH